VRLRKNQNTRSSYAVIVCILRRNGVRAVRTLKPSGRGEFEITDVKIRTTRRKAELRRLGWVDGRGNV